MPSILNFLPKLYFQITKFKKIPKNLERERVPVERESNMISKHRDLHLRLPSENGETILFIISINN